LNSVRERLIVGLCAIVVLAGCANGSATTAATPKRVIVNPSARAHLTYDCSVIEPASMPDSPGPLIYLEPYDDGGSGQSRMCALDWDGKLRGQVARGLATRQSSDGSRLLVIDYPVTDSANEGHLAIDERNHLLGRFATIWHEEAIWADDNRHLCYIEDSSLAGQGGVAYLEEVVPGSEARRVATVGGIAYFPAPQTNTGGPAPVPFIAGPHLLACSAVADRAVIQNPSKGLVSVVRLSDGAELSTYRFGHLFYPYANPVGFERLVASRDGRYLAENIEGAHDVPVIDLFSGTIAARLPFRMVGGFSWDGTHVVAQPSDQVVEVIDWQSQRVVRQLAGSYPFAWARPDSADLLVGVPSTRHQFGLDLYIVRGDGTAFEVARSVEVIGE
jgi:hypothetical protein